MERMRERGERPEEEGGGREKEKRGVLTEGV